MVTRCSGRELLPERIHAPLTQVGVATPDKLYKADKAGDVATAELLRKLGNSGDVARDLAYRLFSVCERKKLSQEAHAYNVLVLGWSEIARLARETIQSRPPQPQLFPQE